MITVVVSPFLNLESACMYASTDEVLKSPNCLTISPATMPAFFAGLLSETPSTRTQLPLKE
jgi:hypothetical protein